MNGLKIELKGFHKHLLSSLYCCIGLLRDDAHLKLKADDKKAWHCHVSHGMIFFVILLDNAFPMAEAVCSTSIDTHIKQCTGSGRIILLQAAVSFGGYPLSDLAYVRP